MFTSEEPEPGGEVIMETTEHNSFLIVLCSLPSLASVLHAL